MLSSDQVVYSSLRPSALKRGWYSKWALSAVRRRGSPLGSDLVQSWPTAWKTRVLPSGLVATSRIIFGAKLSPSKVWVKRSAGSTVCETSAVNGMFDGWPLAMSTFQSLPWAQITTAFESGVQSKFGYGPKIDQ